MFIKIHHYRNEMMSFNQKMFALHTTGNDLCPQTFKLYLRIWRNNFITAPLPLWENHDLIYNVVFLPLSLIATHVAYGI